MINWLISKFKREKKQERDTKLIFNRINGLKITSEELKKWFHDDTTLKVVRLLKLHRRNCLDALVGNPDSDTKLILGRCKGYEDVIELVEELAKKENEEDLRLVVDEYLSNLTTEL